MQDPAPMLIPLLFVLGLFVLQTFVPTIIRHLASKESLATIVGTDIGPRDQPLATTVFAERAARALGNMHEALPVFLGLALLHTALGLKDPQSFLGAWIFFVARTLYVPAYISAVRGLRSLCWSLSWVGLIMMMRGLPLT